MPDLDYLALGLKCGLECHQQLNTRKLFCNCPSVMREDAPDILVKRRIRPVMSELGEYDPAALEAYQKGQTFAYQAYSDTTCLVETDEEPVRPFNAEAFDTVLEVALLLKAHLVDNIYVMRKMVVDGSTTSSFQRTALIATNGCLDFNGKCLGIDTIVLEEDAARPVVRGDKEVVYRLDRQGIPLIEIATLPDIHSPEDAKKVALKIGELLRLTGKARRGLGTIRQDVNVSIRGGTRVELKGVQELDLLDEFVRREAQRQAALLEIRGELLKRVKEADLVPNALDVSALAEGSACKFFADGVRQGKKVLGLRLKGFKGILGREVQPGRRFGKELAGYLKARLGIAGLLHSDELPNYGLTEADVKGLSRQLGLREDALDAFVLVCEEPGKAEEAMKILVERCRQALKGVPPETRGPLPDGNNEYLRPLPGAARMYPETDLPTVKTDAARVEGLRKNLPQSAEERLRFYSKELKLGEKLANEMKLSNEARFFADLVKRGFEPTSTAVLLLEGLTKLKREGVDVDNVSREMVERVLSAQKEGVLVKEAVLGVLGAWAKKPAAPFEEIMAEAGASRASDVEALAIVQKIVARNEGIIKEKGMQSFQAVMGEVMREARGKIPGSMVSGLLKKEIEARTGRK